MRVRINNVLIFDEDTMSFSPINSFLPTVKLGSIHTRCFSYLCRQKIKNEAVVSKKELFYEGWEKHGLVSSDNSLAQTIFQIRKALRPFNLSDSIGTIPRVGFSLRQVDIEPMHPTQTVSWWSEVSSHKIHWPLSRRKSQKIVASSKILKENPDSEEEFTSVCLSTSAVIFACFVLVYQYF